LAKEDPLQILDVDNQKVRNSQIERLNRIKTERDNEKVAKALDDITKCAHSYVNSTDSPFQGNGNLLALAVEAARHRATLGEISSAMEKEFGRYKAQIRSFSGVYSKEMKKDES